MEYSVKCIALDLDRTTLGRRGELPPENRAALEAAIAAGVTVVVASGRPFGALPEEIRSFPGIEYAITGNGCTVCRQPEGTRIREFFLPAEAVDAILDRCEGEPVSLECFIGGQGYADAAYWRDPVGHGAQPDGINYIRTTRIPVENMPAFMRENRSRLDALDIITRTGAERDALWQELERTVPGIYLTSSIEQLLEISSADSGKGRALAWLLAELGIDPADTAAFGDGDNDADMLSSVGWGIAVENATPACRAAARFVTATFDEAGVAKAISEHLTR